MFYSPQISLLSLLISLILADQGQHIHEHQSRFSSICTVMYSTVKAEIVFQIKIYECVLHQRHWMCWLGPAQVFNGELSEHFIFNTNKLHFQILRGNGFVRVLLVLPTTLPSSRLFFFPANTAKIKDNQVKWEITAAHAGNTFTSYQQCQGFC